jgi:hypothetical protein
MVLSCRPHAVANVTHARPYCFWPVDVMNLTELLLLAGTSES